MIQLKCLPLPTAAPLYCICSKPSAELQVRILHSRGSIRQRSIRNGSVHLSGDRRDNTARRISS